MKKFELIKDYYEDVELFENDSIELKPGLTVLVGCNGIGKTTLLYQIKDRLDKEDIPYIEFDNLHHGGSNARSKAGFYGDFNFLATSMCSSEGENIMMNMGKLAGDVGNFVNRNQDKNEFWILLDAVDSGLSIDNVIDLKDFFNVILTDPRNQSLNIYIVVSANEYEMANGEQCFDVYNGKYVSFEDYNSFRNFILQSKTWKDNRN